MKNKLVLLLFLSVSSFSLPLIAETFSYTSVSLSYGHFRSNIDGVSEPLIGDGYTIDLSYAVRQHAALFAGYSISIEESKIDGNDVNADIDSYILGMTVHFPINDATDLVVNIGFFNGKADVNINGDAAGDVRANGGVVTLGFRSMLSKDLEFNASLRKNAIEERSTISLDMNFGYYVFYTVSLNLGYRIDMNDRSDLVTLGVIKYF